MKMTDQSSHEIRSSPGDRAAHPGEASTVTQHHNSVVSEAPTVVSDGSKKNRPSQPSRDPNALVQGERLDHFELQEYIDVGGMGTVFRAWDTKLQRQVAVKVLPQEYAENRESNLADMDSVEASVEREEWEEARDAASELRTRIEPLLKTSLRVRFCLALPGVAPLFPTEDQIRCQEEFPGNHRIMGR